ETPTATSSPAITTGRHGPGFMSTSGFAETRSSLGDCADGRAPLHPADASNHQAPKRLVPANGFICRVQMGYRGINAGWSERRGGNDQPERGEWERRTT